MSEKNELFSRRYDIEPAKLFDTLQQALVANPSVTTQRVADGNRIEFRTTATLTSWGDNMVAEVEPADEGSVLRVYGEPRAGAVSTSWGEEMHATQIEQQLFSAIDTQLAASRS